MSGREGVAVEYGGTQMSEMSSKPREEEFQQGGCRIDPRTRLVSLIKSKLNPPLSSQVQFHLASLLELRCLESCNSLAQWVHTPTYYS